MMNFGKMLEWEAYILGLRLLLLWAKSKIWRINIHIWIMDRLYWICYGEKLWEQDK